MSAITIRGGFFNSEYSGPKLPEELAGRYDDIMLAPLKELVPRPDGRPYTAAEKAAYKAKEFLTQGSSQGDLSLFTLHQGGVGVFIDKMKSFFVVSQRDIEREFKKKPHYKNTLVLAEDFFKQLQAVPLFYTGRDDAAEKVIKGFKKSVIELALRTELYTVVLETGLREFQEKLDNHETIPVSSQFADELYRFATQEESSKGRVIFNYPELKERIQAAVRAGFAALQQSEKPLFLKVTSGLSSLFKGPKKTPYVESQAAAAPREAPKAAAVVAAPVAVAAEPKNPLEKVVLALVDDGIFPAIHRLAIQKGEQIAAWDKKWAQYHYLEPAHKEIVIAAIAEVSSK